MCHIDILLCHIDTGYCLGKPIVSQRDMFVSYRNVGKFSFVEGIWLVMSQRHWTVSHRYLSVSYGHLSVSYRYVLVFKKDLLPKALFYLIHTGTWLCHIDT